MNKRARSEVKKTFKNRLSKTNGYNMLTYLENFQVQKLIYVLI